MQKDEQNEKIAEPAVAQKRVQKPTAQDWFEKGYHAQHTNRLEEACVCYSQVIELEKRHTPAYNNWGETLLELAKMRKDENLFKRAFKKYAKAVSLEPRNPLLLNNWANALADYGKVMGKPGIFQDAFRKYMQALRYAPRDAAQIEELLKQVVALAGDTSAIYNLACLYALTGRKDDALRALKTALMNRHPITWQELEEEADLASLKGDADFIALMETYFPGKKFSE